MSRRTCWLLTGVLFLAGSSGLSLTERPARAGEKDEGLCANPYYTFWAGSRKGATAVHRLKTKLATPEGKPGREVIEERRITYTLRAVDDKKVVVEVVVTEPDYFGYLQAAPTRHIYPKQVKKAELERFLLATGAKAGKETIAVQGKELKCKTVAAVIKKPGGEETNYKIWLSDEVPGSIVKKVRTTRQGGKMIAETTITLESYRKPD